VVELVRHKSVMLEVHPHPPTAEFKNSRSGTSSITGLFGCTGLLTGMDFLSFATFVVTSPVPARQNSYPV